MQMSASGTARDTAGFNRLLRWQTERMVGSSFRDSGFTGKGVRIAVFDVGFPKVDTHEAFEHIRKRNGIAATYDFSLNDANVYRGMNHGTAVLSCLAGMYDSIPMGLATDAEFLLARTERLITEWSVEEFRWVVAAEWADRNGADIISSSLGYTAQRYFPEEMDGQTAPVSRAANIAASKGILVINSAGNDGDSRWRTVGAPADADSVLAVGGTNPYTDIAIDFSSFGPTADLRLKPNLCAFGEAVTASRNDHVVSFGTSFACPLIAGFAACAMQARPELSTMELFKALEQSGHLYPYFDYVHGYGVPLADKFVGLKQLSDTTFRFERIGDGLMINLVEVDFPEDLGLIHDLHLIGGGRVASQFQLPEGTIQRNLYYHVRDERGVLLRFGAILPYERTPLILYEGVDFKAGQTVSVHYEGFTNSILIEGSYCD
jgi:subtilisin family serine protease